MRIALFGGTFDPPHLGHLRIAAAAADRFALDRILFAPTGWQPLKAKTAAASFADRLAMTELACQTDTRFTPTDVDAPRAGGPNYTVESLSALGCLYPEATIFHLGGADSFLSLPEWRDPARLLALADWIVISRPGSPLAEEQIRSTLAAALGVAPTAAQIARVHLLTGMAESISATELRRRLGSGEDTSGVLSPAVSDYIAVHHLYR